MNYIKTKFGLLWALLLLVTSALLLNSCRDNDIDNNPNTEGAPRNVLYVQSNNYAEGQNSILAYRRDTVTGALTQFGTYLTGGKGHINPTRGKLGPNDLDRPMVVAADGKRLFSVNSGSNTIAVLNISADGTLTPISGSPFPSGGRNPVSVNLSGNRLYVVNKNEDAAQLPNNDLPNYVGFTVGASGSVTQISGAIFTTVAMASPSHALTSSDGRFLFVEDFLAPAFHPGIGSIHSFRIEGNGKLTPSPGSPKPVPPGMTPPLPLGIWQHPSQNILYVGFVTRAQLGVYDINNTTGELTYVTAVANSGKEICWVRTAASGSRIYTVNNIDNSVSFYDNANPRSPVERQKLTMKEPGPMFLNDRGEMSFMQITSTPFQPGLSPDERFLYVVNQRSDHESSYQQGNNIHILTIAADGTLSEPGNPIELPVPPKVRPQGLIVF